MALNNLLKCNSSKLVVISNILNKKKHDPQLFSHSLRFINLNQPNLTKKEYQVTFIKPNGEKIKAKGKEGDSLLDVVINNDLDFDGFGACEGTLTCSTCHVILKQKDYDRLPDKPSEEENDMLDLAFGLTDTSRLGCQIIMTKELDGLEVGLPETINDARS
ncbi:adrenodoxin-like protein 2, mitochondrial [Halyomorpha halys]|uniref:adrenodoxin-like protein 2, mitochondrial n=1 Tax=Halyomorpha halys TaxID=286706 RepID=UPI0006D5014E|nr:adrenodoxin [Halyomorpha halys]